MLNSGVAITVGIDLGVKVPRGRFELAHEGVKHKHMRDNIFSYIEWKPDSQSGPTPMGIGSNEEEESTNFAPEFTTGGGPYRPWGMGEEDAGSAAAAAKIAAVPVRARGFLIQENILTVFGS